MTEHRFANLIEQGHETRGVEFKGPGSRIDNPYRAKVVKAVLGMANRRDGGFVIIGVEEDEAHRPVLKGLTDDQLKSWNIYDDVAASINEYASPSVDFDLEVCMHQGNRFTILNVHEFEDIPILCRKEYQEKKAGGKKIVLREGACYVRPLHKPETSELLGEEEMRELLERAIDKGLRKFVARAKKAGLIPPWPSLQQSDQEEFKRQVEDLL